MWPKQKCDSARGVVKPLLPLVKEDLYSSLVSNKAVNPNSGTKNFIAPHISYISTQIEERQDTYIKDLHRYAHRHRQTLDPILATLSSNRVVKFTNILNLSAIKFHIPSIQFLKGSESSAVMRGNARASQGTRTGQVQRAGIPGSSGDSTAHLLFHSWIKCSLLPLGTVKVTARGLNREMWLEPKTQAED